MKGCLLALALLLGACATTAETLDRPLASEEDGNLFTDAVSSTFYGVVDTVKTPFYDLGLIRDDIPQELKAAAGNPYGQPATKKCKAILEEIAKLNELLGDDKYAVEVIVANNNAEEEESYLSEGIQLASTMAISKAGKKVALPFRGLIRRVSGTSAHEKKSQKAYDAGEIRRAYLRGLADGSATNCYKQPKKKAKTVKQTKDA